MSPRVLRGLLLAVPIGLTSLLLLVRSSPAQAPPDLNAVIRQRITEWETNPDLKPFAILPTGSATQDPSGTTSPGDSSGSSGRGFSIHIAVPVVDPAVYGQGVVDLPATVADARAMRALASQQGFTVLRDMVGQIKGADVIAALTNAAGQLKRGDTLLVTYSGHGSQAADGSRSKGITGDEEDGMDETWCLFDGHLYDDELVACWKKFEPGVRIVVVLDSCHSSTATRVALSRDAMFDFAEVAPKGDAAVKEFLTKRLDLARAIDEEAKPRQVSVVTRSGGVEVARIEEFKSRLLPPLNALNAYNTKRSDLERRQVELAEVAELKAPGADLSNLNPTVITLAGCADNQESWDDGRNGFMTRALLDEWANGTNQRSYERFMAAVSTRVRQRTQSLGLKRQDPTFNVFGRSNTPFVNSTAFSLR